MFHQKDKREKTRSVKPVKIPKDLTAMAVPLDILDGGKRQTLIQQMRTFSDLPTKRFDDLCLSLIYQLVNYCQFLPETVNSYYALPAGMLDYALNRAEAAMQLLHDYLIPNEQGGLSDIQRLWLYAMLSASLLKDIGKLQIDYQVRVFDPFGQPLKQWNPLIESLISAGSYYQFEFLLDHEDKRPVRRRINLLLARLLMPNEGFSWIASNPEVLATWLALLSDDWQSAGTLGAILIRADAIAIQRYFNDHLLHHVAGKQGTGGPRIGTFIDTKPTKPLAKEQLTGIQFIKWLSLALDSGQIMINKAPLLMVPGGLLIHPDIFKYFVRAHPEYKNWQAIQSGFLSLGLHRLNVNGETLSRFEQENNHQMHDGVLFSKYAIVLPKSVKTHHLSTGKISTMSAVELIHLAQYNQGFSEQGQALKHEGPKHLTVTGHWKIMAAGALSKMGLKKGG